jgi:hypothetical protein
MDKPQKQAKLAEAITKKMDAHYRLNDKKKERDWLKSEYETLNWDSASSDSLKKLK